MILKYKYYIHHVLSIIIIIILSLIIDLVLENYTHSNTFSLIGSIGFIIADGLQYTYLKYIIIGFEIGKIPSNIIETENDKKWVVLVLSILQVLSLLLYLEIIEFNFCKLNKNTKKNIERRLLLQSNEDNEENEITIKDYDISEAIIQQEIEMGAMFTEEDEED